MTSPAEPSSAAPNEQTKLLATALNNIAVAFIVIRVVTPITAVSFGIANAPPLGPATIGFAFIRLCAGTALHWIGRRVPRSLRP